MSGIEVIQANHRLNDKLLTLRARARRFAEFTTGPVPPVNREKTLSNTAPLPQDPPFLDQLFNLNSTGHDLADELSEILTWLEQGFSVPDGPMQAGTSR